MEAFEDYEVNENLSLFADMLVELEEWMLKGYLLAVRMVKFENAYQNGSLMFG